MGGTTGGKDVGFTVYPLNRVIGVLEGPEELQKLADYLSEAGISKEDVDILAGEEGVRRLDRSGEHHGPLVGLVRLVQYLGEEQVQMQRYEEELRSGNLIVSLPVRELSKARAADILKASGAHFVHFYGPLMIERV